MKLLAVADGSAGVLSDHVTEEVVQIVKVSFRPGPQWRFARTGQRFLAAMRDSAFLAQVAAGDVAFGLGDALRVRLRTVIAPWGNGYAARYEVLQVLEHLPGRRPRAE